MNEAIRLLEPSVIWNNFADLNAVPRPSKKEGRIIQFIKEFGERLNLETVVDKTGNVIIRKAATKNMEDRANIVLQSHIDMVHQKNSDRSFDFDTQGIEMNIDDGWVRANGTTLGADNGIGVAIIMSILAANDIPHPALEALFTIDEETGMTGALALEAGMLEGKILLNLDTEEDTELTIGCAGGIDVTASGSYEQLPCSSWLKFLLIVKGLTGGHSGMDIYKGRGNANKIMNRILLKLLDETGIAVISINGGSLRNAIPRESVAMVAVDKTQQDKFKQLISYYTGIIKEEYHFTDPNVDILSEPCEYNGLVAEQHFMRGLLRSIYACPNGIYRMSPGIEGLVQSSNNIARILVENGKYSIQCLTRSAVDSEKTDLVQAISAVFELIGGTIELGSDYPGWEPRPDAPIVKLMSGLYKELFNESPKVDAVHAGLECGIIGSHYPGMQMISFGPNIIGAHSPDERVQISSVQKFWKFLLETLQRIPTKD